MTDEKKPRGTLIRELAWLYMQRVLILLCFAGLWWAAVRFGLADKFFISTPLDVIQFLFSNFWKEIVPNAVDTLRAMLIAFVLSSVAGMLSGLALVELPR